MDAPVEQPMAPVSQPAWWRRILRRLMKTLTWLALSVLILLTILYGLTATPVGLSRLASAVQSLSGGAVQLTGLQGSLWQRLQIAEGDIRLGQQRIQFSQLVLDWRPSLLVGRSLVVDQLSAQTLILDLPPSNEPTTLPTTLRLPLAIRARQVQLGQLKLVQENLLLSGLSASLQSDGAQHQLQLQALTSPWGRGSGQLTLQGDAPFPLHAQLTAQGGISDHPVTAQATLGGDLRQLQIQLNGQSGEARMRLAGEIAPFAPNLAALVHHLQGELKAVDLPGWVPGAPRALLDGTFSVTPAPHGWRGQIDLVNRQAGRWDEHAIPVNRVQGGLRYADEVVIADQLLIQRNGGQVLLNGKLSKTQLALTADLKHLNPKTLHSVAQPMQIDGSLQLTGTPEHPALQADLQAGVVSLSAKANWQRTHPQSLIALEQARLTHQAGRAELSGQLALAGQRAFELDLALDHFKPQAFVNVPPADINLTATATGTLHDAWQVAGQFELLESKLSSLSMKGQGRVKIDADRVEQLQLDLVAGPNRVQAKGALGRAGDELTLDLQAPDLNLPEYHLAGSIQAQATLHGRLKQPALQADITSQNLSLPGGVKVAGLTAVAHFAAEQGGRLDATVNANGLAWADKQVNRVQFAVEGTRDQHQARLQLDGQIESVPLALKLALAGTLSADNVWQGQLTELENTGRYALKLQQPAPLLAGAEQVSLQAASFLAVGSPIQIDRLQWQPSGLEVIGQGQIDTARVLSLLEQPPPIQSTLVLDTRWRVQMAEHWDGELTLKRRQGDLVLTEVDNSQGVPLQLADAAVQVQIRQDLINAQAQLTSTTLGGLRAQLDGALHRQNDSWGLSPAVPLRWRANGEMASIAWAGPLIGPMVRVAGRLALDVSGEYQSQRHQLLGWVQGNDLVLNDPDRGLAFKEGQLRAELQQDRLLLKQLTLKAGQGELSGNGTLALSADAPSADLQVKASRFTVLSRPDRQLVISGSGQMQLNKDALHLDAKLKADEGMFLADRGDMPTLGDDVVIVGRGNGKPKAATAFPLYLTAEFDLGEKLKVQGYGLDATLGGSLAIKATPRRPLSASGTVEVTKGRYAAYGQKLSVQRGLINFQGPLDNPSLDILAIRENLSVEVGVQVAGTAQAPRVTLYSSEAMPDTEKISWLVLGHSGANVGQGDAGALLLAASGLLDGNAANSFAKTLADTFGLDEIGIGSGSNAKAAGTSTGGEGGGQGLSLNTQVITLGKRLSDRAYLAYEQGLTSASAAVKLTYQISKRLSVVAKAGQHETHVDVQFTHRFDISEDR
ncbi:translocation and assembly module TamB [Chitinivorax tropicus]|uniref:Translocation and assembly module TamB n=1 Tax=Chitinivorax tropicus TaxID=714531 RepID=A0A840ML69_9PROT|nr:translocation/assembly module TamB domain-containing protein [Chitinivorax tropicus]MBB5018245.1 translocation and assembly module TamB [Chitinivorax tropicus]